MTDTEKYLEENSRLLELYLTNCYAPFDKEYLSGCPLECVEDILRPYDTT